MSSAKNENQYSLQYGNIAYLKSLQPKNLKEKEIVKEQSIDTKEIKLEYPPLGIAGAGISSSKQTSHENKIHKIHKYESSITDNEYQEPDVYRQKKAINSYFYSTALYAD